MMTAKRRTGLKYTLLTATAGLIVACWLALAGACGPVASPFPAAPGGDSGATPTPILTPTIWWLGDTPSPARAGDAGSDTHCHALSAGLYLSYGSSLHSAACQCTDRRHAGGEYSHTHTDHLDYWRCFALGTRYGHGCALGHGSA